MLPPGPRGPAAYTLLRYVLRPGSFFADARAQYGPNFTAQLGGLGRFVFLGDPAAIKDVFLGDPAILRTGEANAFVRDVVGESSLLTLDGDRHARQRRALIPPLHGENLDRHMALMGELCRREIERWRVGEAVRLEDACREITRQAILRVVFGMDEGRDLDVLSDLVRDVMAQLSNPLAFVAGLLPRALQGVTRVNALQRSIDEALYRLIAAKRADSGEGADVLATLLRMRRPDGSPLSDRELRDHLYTMLLAGHDTSAIALAWAFAEILPRPDVLARIHAELDEVVGESPLTPDRVRGLHYLDAAIKESMRLRPLVDFAVRLLAQPFVAGGVTYPAGITLAPCTLLVHMRPDLYPEPEAFRPERFLHTRPDPYAWIPFGGGQRRCLGMNFALFQMRVVLATTLRRVRFAPRKGKAPRFARRGLFLAPSDRATFVPRCTDAAAAVARTSR